MTNRTDTVVRILMLSTVPLNELSICVYPDSDKVGVWPWPGKRLRMAQSVDYWDGELQARLRRVDQAASAAPAAPRRHLLHSEHRLHGPLRARLSSA